MAELGSDAGDAAELGWAPVGWCGEARLLLDDLAYSLAEARGGGVLDLTASGASGRWREDVVASLNGLRDVLVGEATARPTARGSKVLRDRSRLLADLSLQQGLLRSATDDDRLLFELRRLLVQARLHVRASQEA